MTQTHERFLVILCCQTVVALRAVDGPKLVKELAIFTLSPNALRSIKLL